MIKIHSIFPLFNFWLNFLSLFFAAADGGFMASLASEVPMTDLGGDDEPTAEPDKPAGEDTPADGEPTKEGDQTAAVKPAQAGPDLAKPLSSGAKKFLGELKQSDPAAWKELNNRIWSLNGIDKKIAEHFDNGIDDAIKLKTDVDTFLKAANLDNIQEVSEELDGYRITDKKLIAGDHSFINDLPEEAQASLYRMMPNFVEDWRARDADSYQRYFGNLVVATLQHTKFQQNLEMALWKLEEMGLDDPGVKKLHDLFSGNLDWINKLSEKSNAAPEKKPVAANDEVTARERNVQQQELNISRTRVVTRFRQAFDSKMLNLLKTEAGGSTGKIPANVNKSEVLLRAMNNLAKTLGTQVESRIDEYLRGKDEEGAFKYLSSQVSDKRLTTAVSQAYRYLYGAGAPTQVAPKTDGKPPAAAPGTPAAGGFININYNPRASSVDVAATTKLAESMRLSYRQLISQNKCVLKNGKRVTWARDAQDEA
jgi:hypothetical protein